MTQFCTKRQLLGWLRLNVTNQCQEKYFIILSMKGITSLGQRKIYILISNGFNQDEVFGLQTIFRQAGIPIYLMGLIGEPVYSSDGLITIADYTIDQLNGDTFKNQLLIIPGDPACTSYLLVDARIYRIVLLTLQNGGFVAVTKQAYETVTTIYQPLLCNDKSLIFQNGKRLESFARQLLDLG